MESTSHLSSHCHLHPENARASVPLGQTNRTDHGALHECCTLSEKTDVEWVIIMNVKSILEHWI